MGRATIEVGDDVLGFDFAEEEGFVLGRGHQKGTGFKGHQLLNDGVELQLGVKNL